MARALEQSRGGLSGLRAHAGAGAGRRRKNDLRRPIATIAARKSGRISLVTWPGRPQYTCVPIAPNMTTTMMIAPAAAVRLVSSITAAVVSATPINTRNHAGKCHARNARAQPLVSENLAMPCLTKTHARNSANTHKTTSTMIRFRFSTSPPRGMYPSKSQTAGKPLPADRPAQPYATVLTTGRSCRTVPYGQPAGQGGLAARGAARAVDPRGRRRARGAPGPGPRRHQGQLLLALRQPRGSARSTAGRVGTGDEPAERGAAARESARRASRDRRRAESPQPGERARGIAVRRRHLRLGGQRSGRCAAREPRGGRAHAAVSQAHGQEGAGRSLLLRVPRLPPAPAARPGCRRRLRFDRADRLAHVRLDGEAEDAGKAEAIAAARAACRRRRGPARCRGSTARLHAAPDRSLA